jgi:hypothetical protein
MKRARQRHHIVETTEGLTEARERIEPRQPRRLIGLLDGHVAPDFPGMQGFAVTLLRDMP